MQWNQSSTRQLELHDKAVTHFAETALFYLGIPRINLNDYLSSGDASSITLGYLYAVPFFIINGS